MFKLALKRAALFSTAALAAVGIGLLGAVAPKTAHASSHSDAPLIKLDPQANLTDVYAFIRGTGASRVLVVEVSVRPFSEPGDGGEYEAFSDDALYSIHITHPVTGAQLQRYDFRFSSVSPSSSSYKNQDTILRYGRGTTVGAIQNVGDGSQNFTQSYTISRNVGGAVTNFLTNAGGGPLLVPPYNTGVRTTPFYNDAAGRAVSGATSFATLDRYTQQTTYDLAGGLRTFCGSREDGFYSDIPGIFDFLDRRILDRTSAPGAPPAAFGTQGGGVDGFKGYNVLHYSIVIPVSELPAPIAFQAPFTGGQTLPGIAARNGVGVYASVSRPRITLRSPTGDGQSGPFIQVSRLGNPLFNEALVALRDKDRYNRSAPTSDDSFATYALNPELAFLINAVYGQSFATTGRVDLQLVFLRDVLRVDTTTGAARVMGESGFSRLSFLSGTDTLTTSGGAVIPGGWPNGRRFGDDVIDIALTALASGPTYTTVTLVGDNADTNDQVYNQVFPYAATPHAGTRNSKDSGPNVGF